MTRALPSPMAQNHAAYQCIVPQSFNLRPQLLKSIVHVIRLITNMKYAFYCIK